ncbi:hypothetical protein CARUB_v10024582mg [Capsella rubella]|uniref:F-box domain-containing protein n=1 Tax=Capsella rubella TaxID=81985 RepID=R0FZ57_9BRAS|nr:F-box protein At3g62230 [Capsella rubella]EOA28377.1 hypothetical protein CARUB_v10024582mg [Capsella rubella]
MDSRRNQDKISGLPDFILALIISTLPLKEAVKASLVSKGLNDLYRKRCVNNIVFNESEFMKCYAPNDEKTKRVTRVSFVYFMLGWFSRLSDKAIESFELYISKPVGFETQINSLMEFAVFKQVKNLILDFSDPSWTTNNEARVVQLPECFYNLINLESLKLLACGFDPSRLRRPGSLKVLSFGWIQLRQIMSLLSRSPMLESLSIQNCWDVGLEAITGYNSRLRELVFENCGFSVASSTLDLPNILIFKYSGKVHFFEFLRVNREMKEAYLDFGAETAYNEETGTQLSGLLYDLSSATTLTVCPFLIQLVQFGKDPVRLGEPMETRHLVLNTNMHPNEFIGIRLLIKSCRELETLTFQIVAPRPVPMITPPVFDPDTYWKFRNSHACLKETLKVVKVRDFTGGMYELLMLQFLFRCGLVLERVELYLPKGLGGIEKRLALAAAQEVGMTFKAASVHLRIFLRNV